MALVSVIMGVYNCEATLGEALESLLGQTVTDWDCVLCDDGSGDGTYAVAERYARQYPGKFILLKNKTNLGLNATLNRCLKEAGGRYIARMDGDDTCDPGRFEAELAVLEGEPDIGFVSTDMTCFDEKGAWGRVSHPAEPAARDFLHGTPFCHAPCMVRREAYEAVRGYSEGRYLQRVEDYHLWLKLYAAGFRGKNIPRPLYAMRDDRNARNRRKFRYRINEAWVRVLAVKELKLPLWGYAFALRPILVGLMPGFLYDIAHKRRLRPGQDRKRTGRV